MCRSRAWSFDDSILGDKSELKLFGVLAQIKNLTAFLLQTFKAGQSVARGFFSFFKSLLQLELLAFLTLVEQVVLWMVYVRKRYSSTVKGTLCCWQVKVILLSFLVFSHRNRFTESNLKLGCSTYVTWLLQTCHLAIQFCFFKRKETEEEQTCKLSKRTEEHLVYLLKSRSSESSFHKNLMSLPLCDRLMLWLWHDVSCTSAAIGTTSAETCLGPAGHGHGGLSTYLFVCVLRRSFTSISKISFWLKLDFNLSANAVMLLKKTPWRHHVPCI